jgi:carbohydrate-selective porin OprB
VPHATRARPFLRSVARSTAFASPHRDSRPRRRSSAGCGGGETAVEIFHRFDLGRCVAIQPDLQWIGSPGGGDPSDADDAWIATLRLQIAF